MLIYSQGVWPSSMVNQKWAKHLQVAWTAASNNYKHQSFPRSTVYIEVIKEYFQGLITKDLSTLNAAASMKFDIIQYFPTVITAGIIKYVQ